jgi:hypothetical protein
MANNQSVVTRTGQVWKLRLMPIGVALGSPLILIAVWHQYALPRGYFISVLLIGLFINLFALVFPALAIRCPRCGSHWLWAAYRKPHKIWYRWLMTLISCPVCDSPPMAAERGDRKRLTISRRAGAHANTN